VELPAAGGGGRERLGPQDSTELVERRGDVKVLVGVDAAGDDDDASDALPDTGNAL
jgi:hypothetical protein